MIARSTALRRANSLAEASRTRICQRAKGTSAAISAADSLHVASPKDGKSSTLNPHFKSITKVAEEKRTRDKEFLVSVLESASATKRDAKQYLQTFGPTVEKPGQKRIKQPTISPLPDSKPSINDLEDVLAVTGSPKFEQGTPAPSEIISEVLPHVAIVKLREPQSIDDVTIEGVAKTFAQLRALGLLSIVVVDCDVDPATNTKWLELTNQQVNRLAGAIDSYDQPFTSIVDEALVADTNPLGTSSTYAANSVLVEDERRILHPLKRGAVTIIPAYITSQDRQEKQPVKVNDIIVSLTRFLSGLQFHSPKASTTAKTEINGSSQPTKKALVDRVIVLDPLGGIPAKDRGNNAHVFLNLEDEFATAKGDLEGMSFRIGQDAVDAVRKKHIDNLELAKTTLAILPPTSSALLTTPTEAANLAMDAADGDFDGDITGLVGTVGTRRRHNPLIHNLLTDRPSFSASLPLSRIKPITRSADPSASTMSVTTLAKRGMPVTIFPDPRVTPWTPPRPGQPRLRLTDTNIDLPRLVHLINDSFNRKLDVQHYLERVKENLAGIIIAGEYEGGAILTWERPFGLDEETAYRTGRLVPYLDKFAVLKKSQGAGGVADIVFNAMVRDCFPGGVCWRSRKNNPVNKWYFERSRGSWKLGGTEWTMFWTTPSLVSDDQKVRDCEDVCRNVLPSWADAKHIAD